MKNTILLLFILLCLFSCQSKQVKEATEAFILSDVEKLATGFSWAEGPAADAQGNVYFTDVPNSRIFIWTIENKLDTMRIDSGGANGLFFDKDGNLLTCEMYNGRLTSTSPNGEYMEIVGLYNGKRFNEPNDLWIDENGGIYFTDPKYGPDVDKLSQDGMHVYYILPKHDHVIRVVDDLEKPNGIIGTADGKRLYVTDHQAEKTYQYDIQTDGTLQNKSLFVPYGSDGMTIDTSGNVYLTTNGKNAVEVFSPQGKLLHDIPLPERVANVAFGGKNKNELYITANSSLYHVKLNAQGVDRYND